jgi:hypothetical protein
MRNFFLANLALAWPILGALAACSGTPIDCCITAQFVNDDNGPFVMRGVMYQDQIFSYFLVLDRMPSNATKFFDSTANPDEVMSSGDGWHTDFDQTFAFTGRLDTGSSGWGQLELPAFQPYAVYCPEPGGAPHCWGGLNVEVNTPQFQTGVDDVLMATVRVHGPMDIFDADIGGMGSNVDNSGGQYIAINFTSDGAGSPVATPEPGTAFTGLGGLLLVAASAAKRALRRK